MNMRKNKNNALIKQSNHLSESRKNWTILMARAYCRIIAIFGKKVDAWIEQNNEDKNQTYLSLFPKITNTDILSHRITRYDLAVIGKDGKIDLPTKDQFFDAFSRLSNICVHVEKPRKNIRIVGTIEEEEEGDCLIVHQDLGTIKYLLALKDKYTIVDPSISTKFQKSKYSWPFYEWCCKERKKGKFKLSVKDIKERLMLDEYVDEQKVYHPEKFKCMRDFLKYVVDPARDELQELFDAGDCDVCFEYEPILDKSKPGRRKVVGFDFTIIKLEKPKDLPKPKPKPTPQYLWDNYNQRLQDLRSVLIPYWSRSNDKNWPYRAINELGKQVVNDISIMDKVEKYVYETIKDYEKGKVKNVPGSINGYFKKKLGIDVSIKKEITKG